MNKLLTGLLIIAVGITAYYTHRLWVFGKKVSYGFEYTYAAIDCLIQENGQAEGDIEVLFKGYKSRRAYANAVNRSFPGLYPKDDPFLVRKSYNDQLPECKVFYSQYRCWELDPHDPKSLDGCGLHFGLSQQEIDTMKKDPSTIDKVMDTNFNRRKMRKNE